MRVEVAHDVHTAIGHRRKGRAWSSDGWKCENG